MNFLKLKLYKLTHWEYWPLQAIYYPLFPVWLYYSIRAKSFFFFNAANPSIKNGGMAMESKKEIYDLIPPLYIPKTILLKKDRPLDEILEALLNADIHFPMIAKPDIGMKAFGVDILEDERGLRSYIHTISGNFLVQELIRYPNEVGIFYVRRPNEALGRITGIVSKEFLSVTGNGKDSILQLIKQDPRSHFQLASLKRKYGHLLEQILDKGEKYMLVPFGSHTRGAKFLDGSDKLNESLLDTINAICTQIPGFYYGRLDILHTSFEELCEGKNFRIIEINGAGSEPTHIYDPKHSLFFAWYEITRHWRMLYQISALNHKKGHAYLSYRDGTAMLRANSELEAQLKLI
jgi:hypothetical protein